jgi:hypothetical protein
VYLTRRWRAKIFLLPTTRRDSGFLRVEAALCSHLRRELRWKTCMASAKLLGRFVFLFPLFPDLICPFYIIIFFHVMYYSNLLTCSMHDSPYCRLTEQWRTAKLTYGAMEDGENRWAKVRACTKIPRSVCDGFSQTCSIDKTVTTTAPCTSPVHGSVFNRAAFSDVRAVLHAAKSKEAIRVKQGTHPPFFPSIY